MKKIISREVIVTFLVYFGFMLWWYYFSYIYPPKNVNEYKYIFGLPSWFFYSCILGYILFNIVVLILVKYFYVNIDLEEIGENVER